MNIKELREKKAGRTKKANIVIQSPMGGEITTDSTLERIVAYDLGFCTLLCDSS